MTNDEIGTGSLDWIVNPGQPATIETEGLTDLRGAISWLTETQSALRAGLHEYGAVFLRGLPIRGVDDFARIRDTLMPERTPYREKATPRSSFGDDVYSSTDLPASQVIRMHNENSYTLTFPGLLMFACLTAPEAGGATPVADCRKILRDLPPQLVARMRATGWLLTRSYSEHISTSWQTAFAAETADDVERYCTENLIAWQWQPDGHLRTSQLRPGIITHPETGDEVWFNHLAFWNELSLDEELRETLIDEFGPDDLPFNTRFGDGERLTSEEFEIIDAAYEAATVRHQWRPGDLMLVDNIASAHGRDAFRGDRRIVVAMGKPTRVADCRPTVAPAAAAMTKEVG
ncbi:MULTISPECIES: TauD/TfdA family dioxygenase [unclassified Nocardia]|uniref:TauD/TfdA family dioxygenase n=1 Tax=unclassified Nocardia TaxID=2637762 RepID=UPI001CE3CEF7|nr:MULTISPECIES: TauD/TfdA family dioxygenase [unclassified Nocardia]